MTGRRGRVAALAGGVVLAVAAAGAAVAVGGGDLFGAHESLVVGGATSSTVSSAAPSSRAKPGPGAAYVHMGDSYAAGTGPFDLVPEAPVHCMRTTENPGAQVARAEHWTLHDVACASAKTENLYVEQYFGAGPQLDALGPETRVVTVVLGANDEDFFDTLVKKCANMGDTDPSGSPCRDALGDEFETALRTGTGPNLTKAFADIAAAAPAADIYAIGYPWIVPESGACRPALRFADGDIAFAREMQALLNTQVRAAVTRAGGVYVDMAGLSEGHDACASPEERWIEPAYDVETGRPMGLPAMHPNPRGQRAMADAVKAAIARTP